MALTLDQIVEEASQLPADVSAELVERILIARHGGMSSDIETAWITESRRRIAEISTGQVQGIPLEDSLVRAARALHQ